MQVGISTQTSKPAQPTTMATSIQLPTMDWGSSNQTEAFKLFKQRLELYFSVRKTEEDNKVPLILLAVGEEGLRRFNSWTVSEEEAKDPKFIFKGFLDQLEPPENYRISRLKLCKLVQKPEESLDGYMNRCKLLAKNCQFTTTESDERLIELIIASTPIPEYQKELLTKEKGLSLANAIELGRGYEAAANHLRELQNMNKTLPVDAFQQIQKSACKNCGRNHKLGRENCPA